VTPMPPTMTSSSKSVSMMISSKTVIWLVLLGILLNVKASPSQIDTNYYGDQADDYDYHNYEDDVQGDVQDEGQSREQNSISDYNPEIISQKEHLIVDNGMTIRLPCMVDQKIPKGVQFIWRKMDSKNTMIAIGTTVYDVFSSRAAITMSDRGSTLTIGAAKTTDAGDYKCEVAIQQSKRPELVHTVSIRAPSLPPSIASSSPLSPLTVDKGQDVTLTCKGKGIPEPEMKWTRWGKKMPSGKETEEGDVLTFSRVTRHHSGTYKCTASNGHGQEATKQIVVDVRYSPEVEISEMFVHKRAGDQAELVCTVHAFPPATVIWTKGGSPVSQDDRITISNRGGRHAVIFKKVVKEDFGEYSCQASNEVGEERNTKIQLSGHAKPAEFKSSATGEEEDSFLIQWSAFSLSPIEEFRLETSTSPSGSWTVQGPTPPTKEDAPFRWAGKFYLKGLDGATQYRARVTTRNEEGWGKPGPEWNFATKGAEPSLHADGGSHSLSGSSLIITGVLCIASWAMMFRTGLA